MTNQLTGFDLLMLISKEKVRVDMVGDEVVISVAEGLPEMITKASGVQISEQTIQNMYVELCKLLGGIKITLEENTDEEGDTTN